MGRPRAIETRRCLSIRLFKAEIQRFERAALVDHQSLTDWMRLALVTHAERAEGPLSTNGHVPFALRDDWLAVQGTAGSGVVLAVGPGRADHRGRRQATGFASGQSVSWNPVWESVLEWMGLRFVLVRAEHCDHELAASNDC